MRIFRAKKVRQQQVSFRRPVALCLGGGGARGFAHIGALKAFEEEGLSFPFVIGTSVGSMLGAFYAAGFDTATMMEIADNINLRDIHNGIMILPNDPMKIGKIVNKYMGERRIESLEKRLVIVATDLVEGKQFFFEEGDVATAVAASCCVPLFFKPVVHGKMHLVDGGLLNNIPADVARMLGADAVITVDINPTRGGGTDSLKLFDIMRATFSIVVSNSAVTGLINSDVIIAPDLSAFKATDKSGYQQMIELGYEAARAKMEEVKAVCFGK